MPAAGIGAALALHRYLLINKSKIKSPAPGRVKSEFSFGI